MILTADAVERAFIAQIAHLVEIDAEHLVYRNRTVEAVEIAAVGGAVVERAAAQVIGGAHCPGIELVTVAGVVGCPSAVEGQAHTVRNIMTACSTFMVMSQRKPALLCSVSYLGRDEVGCLGAAVLLG